MRGRTYNLTNRVFKESLQSILGVGPGVHRHTEACDRVVELSLNALANDIVKSPSFNSRDTQVKLGITASDGQDAGSVGSHKGVARL